ncbi:uncharacterized protein LOC125153145 [Prionailurus viverrinus]|uniref:uncharacterized protein LOC125153145 n=1 Tax=Prionailurus viverrinus TaxID=61388 RepID=UPI001FF12D93|nr:uncharacterized protein LOC125153145 [Prionailurus viverrinus]
MITIFKGENDGSQPYSDLSKPMNLTLSEQRAASPPRRLQKSKTPKSKTQRLHRSLGTWELQKGRESVRVCGEDKNCLAQGSSSYVTIRKQGKAAARRAVGTADKSQHGRTGQQTGKWQTTVGAIQESPRGLQGIFCPRPRPRPGARGRLDLPAESGEGVGAPPSRPRRRRRQHHGPRRRCRCPLPACSPCALFLLQTFGFCGRQETGATLSKSSWLSDRPERKARREGAEGKKISPPRRCRRPPPSFDLWKWTQACGRRRRRPPPPTPAPAMAETRQEAAWEKVEQKWKNTNSPAANGLSVQTKVFSGLSPRAPTPARARTPAHTLTRAHTRAHTHSRTRAGPPRVQHATATQ